MRYILQGEEDVRPLIRERYQLHELLPRDWRPLPPVGMSVTRPLEAIYSNRNIARFNCVDNSSVV